MARVTVKFRSGTSEVWENVATPNIDADAHVYWIKDGQQPATLVGTVPIDMVYWIKVEA